MAFSKGQNQVLEIVVALFVLLIVGWLLINWVTKTTQEGQSQIGGQLDVYKEEKIINDAKKQCSDLCSKISDSRGDSGDVVTFCSTVPNDQGLDIDSKGATGYAEISGQGVCKERIPCFELISCSYPTSAPAINAKTCKASICSFYTGKGLSGSRLNQELNNRLAPGACYDSTNTTLHWFALAFNNAEPGTLGCS